MSDYISVIFLEYKNLFTKNMFNSVMPIYYAPCLAEQSQSGQGLFNFATIFRFLSGYYRGAVYGHYVYSHIGSNGTHFLTAGFLLY